MISLRWLVKARVARENWLFLAQTRRRSNVLLIQCAQTVHQNENILEKWKNFFIFETKASKRSSTPNKNSARALKNRG